jgi:hypothetical protein
MRSRLRVLIVTNVAPPYRLPLGEALSQNVDLTIGLLECVVGADGGMPEERTGNWQGGATSTHAYEVIDLPTWRMVGGEAAHDVLKPFRSVRVRDFDVVILGGWESPAYWRLAQGVLGSKRLFANDASMSVKSSRGCRVGR